MPIYTPPVPTEKDIKDAIARHEYVMGEASDEEVNDAMRLIQKVKLYCFRKNPFFGVVASSLNLAVSNSYCGHQVPTALTDGRYIVFNARFVNGLSKLQAVTVFMHEVLHVAYGHHLRMGGRNHDVWNKATDFRINIKLSDDGCSKLDDWLIEEGYRDWNEERIYLDLYSDEQKRRDELNKMIQSALDDMSGFGEGGKGGGGTEVDPTQSIRDIIDGVVGSVKEMLSEDGESLSAQDIKDAENSLREAISAGIQAQKRAGDSGSTSFESEFMELLKPKKDWRSILSRFVKQGATPAGRSWSRLDRRAMANRMYQPHQYKEGMGWLVCGVDVSYSMQEAEWLAVVSHIEAIRCQVPIERVSIVPFNTNVITKDINELSKSDPIPLKLKVGGGTSFKPVFKWVRSQPSMPDAMIMCTDMGADDYGPPIDIPLIWMSTVKMKDSYYGSTVPFGEVVEIDTEEGKRGI